MNSSRGIMLGEGVLTSLLNTAHAQDPTGRGTASAGKTIVFEAGPKDHGAPGRHEYMKDFTVLKYCIDHASNLQGVSTRIYNGKVPAVNTLRHPAATSIAAPDHAILRGVQPITCDEEIFTNEVLPDDPRRTILLNGKSKDGASSVLSWAVQREGGGRGFVMAGLDTHLAVESNRRLVVNDILWGAHVEVPEGGVKCELPDEVMK